MKRLLGTLVAAIVLMLSLTVPAQAGHPHTVYWVCDVPNEGLVTFGHCR